MRPRNDLPLSFRDVCVRLGGADVLDHVDLDVGRGEFVGIVGPNGAGKSTLLRAAFGLVPTTCGEVRLFGAPVRSPRGSPRVGYVPQNVVHVDRSFPATALEVVLLGRVPRRSFWRLTTAEDRKAALAAMDAVGVADLAERRIGALSGGQLQRVFLAKALAQEPELLVLDEPTTGVDPRARQEFYDLLDGLVHDHGLTILLVSHDVQALAMVAHRLVALNRTVVYDGAPAGFEAAGGFGAAYDLHLHHGEGT